MRHVCWISTPLACLLVLSIAGCGGLRLRLVDGSVEEPSNVAVYFTVDTADGEPVAGLTADQFRIYEDGRLISTYESQQTILNPEVAAVRYTLLLLDMSGSVVDSGQVPLIQEAAGAFVDNVGEQEELAIYAFDGRAEIVPIAPFGSRQGRLAARTNGLEGFRSEDPSTNLNGAIIEAVRVIDEARSEAEVPLRFGTLVIFTDGTDRAHRATSSEALRAVNDADVNIYVIGLGGEVDQEEMQNLGRDGFVYVSDQDAIVDAFQDVAARIQGLASRFYLLSYCSPSRAGSHELEVEAVFEEANGSISYRFDAEGFDSGCDPETPPSFDVPGVDQRPRRRTPRRTTAPASGSAGGTTTTGGGDDTMDWE